MYCGYYTKTYWSDHYAFQWDSSKTHAWNDTALKNSPFYYRRPWYSYAYNGLIKANETEPWGNANQDNVSVNRVLGMKRYELTNHLGNVMAVLTDKLTEDTADVYPDITRRASLFASYDYYPFGMLMPQRYVQDDSLQCTPVTRSIMTKTFIPIWDLSMSTGGAESFTPGTGTTTSYDAGAGEVVLGASTGYNPYGEVTLPGGSPTAGKKLAVQALMSSTGPGSVTVKVMQNDGTTDVQIGEGIISMGELETIEVQAISSSDPWVVATSGDDGTEIRIPLLGYREVDDIQYDVVVIECNDDDFDRDYRFGFNGKEKDNEIKGIGNSLDFGARLQDTRLGRWLSLDPLAKKYPFASPYNFVLNTPIWGKDPDGRDVFLITYATKKGDPGHTAIGIENYNKISTRVSENGSFVTKLTYEKDGTVTFYELGPISSLGAGKEAAKASIDDQVPLYKSISITKESLFDKDNSTYEKSMPEGIIQIKTDAKTDVNLHEKMAEYKLKHPRYNGIENNCTDYAKEAIEQAAGKTIDAKENIMLGYDASTPNKLFRETKKLTNAEVKRSPGVQVEKNFKGAYEGKK